jgi:predicted outer membrane repeat protein
MAVLLDGFCLKFASDSYLSCLSKVSNYPESIPFRVAKMRRMVVGVSFALGLFAGTNTLSATTYTVGTLADTAGSCSGTSCTTLRAAMTAANGSSGNTIDLTGVRGIITLTGALPPIEQSMTITGPGASSLTISGNNVYQIFYLIPSTTGAISGLTFANGGGQFGDGGAIESLGTLTVTDSAFSGNFAFNFGGAIESSGTLTVTNCTFSENSAIGGSGGAIFTGGTLTVTNSTFVGNVADYGAGVFNIKGTTAVTGSTFYGNSVITSNGMGGAIYNGDTLTADNNIFTWNVSFSEGAGIFSASAGTVSAGNNLFYQNLDQGGTKDDCNGCTSNTNAINGNPKLLPLGYYGGPTETMLPQPGSPAICAGNYANVPNGVITDQRSFPLTNSTCGSGKVDVGAVQSDYVQVMNTNDSGTGSLRALINAANATAYGGDIDFAPGVTGTITLATILPTIAQSVAIIGPGASTITISGNNSNQIFNINASAVAAISGLTLANGSAITGDGGAINNSGTLTVINSTFSEDSADTGGAIYDSAGPLVVTNCTFSRNSAVNSGGAIYSINDSGALTVTNSTFSANSASGVTGLGGAIANGGALTAGNNIFTGNSASLGGAGIFNDTSPNASTVNASYNLYYQNLDMGTQAQEDDCNGCTSNTNTITDSNPLLAALGSYGGPIQTMLPTPGSPAICAGSISLIPGGVITDQRGFSRASIYNGVTCVDLGAVQTDYTSVAFSSSSYSGVVNKAVNPAPVVTLSENGQNIGGVPITLGYSGTGTLEGLGAVTTVGGTGATFSSLTASSVAQGTLSLALPITASGNSVQPTALTASASLNIRSATQIITFVASSPQTYGNAPIALAATGGASGNPVTFSLDPTSIPGTATLSGKTLTITGVGTIVIDANQAAGNGYAAASQVQQSIMVNRASLTVTASSPTVTYGSAVPTITPIFGTLFNGDTSAVLTKQPTCVTAYTTTSAVGSSPSTSCSGAEAADYTFTYLNGSVTVNPVPTFVVGSGSTSISIAPGATTGNTVPITITPSYGFTGAVNLTCSISPVAASDSPTCSLSPASVTINGTGAQTSTLTISTTASMVGKNRMMRLLWPSAGTTLALMLMIGVPRRRRAWLTMLGVLVLSIAVGAIGCGGGGGTGSSGGNPGTTPGTYTVTVTGASGSVTGTVGTVTLTVQ